MWSYTQVPDFTLENSLFGVVKLTKNADADREKNSSFGIGLCSRGSFALLDGSKFVENVIIFSSDTSSWVHITNKNKHMIFQLIKNE